MPLPSFIPAYSVAPARSRSSSCHIVKSTKVGYFANVDRLASANSMYPDCDRIVAIGADDGGVVLIDGGESEVIGGVRVGGMEGMV